MATRSAATLPALNYGGADPIAWSTSTDPEAGLLLNFYKQSNGKPLFVKPPGIAMGGDDIPNSGISLNGQIYFIVNTGSDTTAANPQVTDYSALVSFDEAAQTFAVGRTISPPGGRFIGTSMHASGSNVYIFGGGPVPCFRCLSANGSRKFVRERRRNAILRGSREWPAHVGKFGSRRRSRGAGQPDERSAVAERQSFGRQYFGGLFERFGTVADDLRRRKERPGAGPHRDVLHLCDTAVGSVGHAAAHHERPPRPCLTGWAGSFTIRPLSPTLPAMDSMAP